jgi:hypothetical protein
VSSDMARGDLRWLPVPKNVGVLIIIRKCILLSASVNCCDDL